jgi:hypothetical protein
LFCFSSNRFEYSSEKDFFVLTTFVALGT